MNRKGAGIHVDWAISMGIFIISLITLILLLRPGVRPLFDTRVLLSLVEERFNNQTLFHVRMVPLHVVRLDSVYKADEPPPKMTVTVKGGGWGFSKIEEPKYTSIVGGSFDYQQPNGGRNFELGCKAKVCSTIVQSRSDYPFNLITAEGNVNDPVPVFDIDCYPSDKDKCDGYLGSSIELEGYNINWINKIVNDQKSSVEYDILKNEWGYPSASDFAIYIQGGGLDQNIVMSPDVSEQANVQARFVRAWVLKDDGSKENITVSFRVW